MKIKSQRAKIAFSAKNSFPLSGVKYICKIFLLAVFNFRRASDKTQVNSTPQLFTQSISHSHQNQPNIIIIRRHNRHEKHFQ